MGNRCCKALVSTTNVRVILNGLKALQSAAEKVISDIDATVYVAVVSVLIKHKKLAAVHIAGSHLLVEMVSQSVPNKAHELLSNVIHCMLTQHPKVKSIVNGCIEITSSLYSIAGLKARDSLEQTFRTAIENGNRIISADEQVVKIFPHLAEWTKVGTSGENAT